MVARRVSFLTVALLALAVSNSVTSGANPKCWPKAQTTPSTDVSTPAPQELEAPSPNTGGSQEYDFGQADGSAETPSTDFTQSSQADTPSTDFTQFSQAGPPSTESSQAGPPSTDFSQAGPPSTDFSQAGPPSTESSQAGPPSTESSQAGPPSTDFSQAGSPPTGSAAGPSPAQSSQEDPTTESSQSSPTQGSSAGGNGTTSGGGGAISFGDITSGSDKCVIGNPNTYLTGKDADWIWENVMKEYIPTFNNLIFDQLVTSKGSLSYCVRWDTDKKLTKAVASKFEAMLTSQLNLWHDWLIGYDCWPFKKIDVTIVGYAVKDKSIMDWTDDSLGTIYEGVLDAEGIPKCPDECYKHLNQAKSADTSACKGKPFDMSFWPSTKPGDGAIGTGGDWGQRVEINDMLATMDQDQMMVLLHEIGHGFGLPELYVAENKPSADFPPSVMDSDLKLTDADGWVLRRVYENIRDRYDF